MMPWPLVQLTRSVSKPIKPRVGTIASTETLCAMVLHVDDLRFAAGEVLHDVAEVFVGNFDVERFDRLEQLAVVVLLVNHFRARDEHLEAFAAHLLDENGDLHFAARPDLEDVRRSSVSLTRRATFVRVSWTSRSRIWRAVTSLPSWPASGPSLTQISIVIVGGSIGDEGQRQALFGIGDRFADEHVFEAGQSRRCRRRWRS